MREPILTDPTQIAAELALLREVLLDFFSGQITAGAAQREEIAAHIQAAGDRVTDRDPLLGPTIRWRVPKMIAALPTGWEQGDWQEPA